MPADERGPPRQSTDNASGTALYDAVSLIRTTRTRAAFDIFYRTAASRVLDLLLQRGIPQAPAEEVAQDVMMTAWHEAPLLSGNVDGGAWIFALTTQIAAVAVRSFERRRAAEAAVMPQMENAPPHSLIERRQYKARVAEALRQLPEDDTALLHDVYFRGLSHRQIAEHRNMPIGTVKSRLGRTMAALRAAVKGD